MCPTHIGYKKMSLLGIVYHTVKMITDSDNCDEYLEKAKWIIADPILDQVGILDIVDVVEESSDN